MTLHIHNVVYKHDGISIKAELSEWLDLLYETMDEIWRSRVPAALEGGSYLLDPHKIINMLAHLAKFFEAADKALQEEACQVIIRMPTFLYLVANVMEKQIEGMYIFYHTSHFIHVKHPVQGI